jgi:hypothetical protein
MQLQLQLKVERLAVMVTAPALPPPESEVT